MILFFMEFIHWSCLVNTLMNFYPEVNCLTAISSMTFKCLLWILYRILLHLKYGRILGESILSSSFIPSTGSLNLIELGCCNHLSSNPTFFFCSFSNLRSNPLLCCFPSGYLLLPQQIELIAVAKYIEIVWVKTQAISTATNTEEFVWLTQSLLFWIFYS